LQRKDARRERRIARAKLKQDDPFSYYFGKVDPDVIQKQQKEILDRKGSPGKKVREMTSIQNA